MQAVVDEVRAFNRFYTRVLGLLRPNLAGSRFGLSEARVLYELAQSDGVDVSTLRHDLDLDAGYLSRILSAFTAGGLVTRERSRTDARRQVVRLTAAGRKAFAELNRLQVEAVGALVEPMDDGQRIELITAMAHIRRLLDRHRRSDSLVLRPPRPGDLGWVVERHGARYAAEYGWDESFEGLAARIVADFADRRDVRREAAWIAELDGRRVGCVFCTAADETGTAALRLLLVEPSARGLGVGTRLVEECIHFAQSTGYTRMTLWTNDILVAARRIYERAGFRCDRREPHHSFGHDLVGEYWSRDL